MGAGSPTCGSHEVLTPDTGSTGARWRYSWDARQRLRGPTRPRTGPSGAEPPRRPRRCPRHGGADRRGVAPLPSAGVVGGGGPGARPRDLVAARRDASRRRRVLRALGLLRRAELARDARAHGFVLRERARLRPSARRAHPAGVLGVADRARAARRAGTARPTSQA